MRVFDEIKAYADSGKDMNQFHSKEAVLFLFLDSYYQHDVYDYEDATTVEITLPLDKRPSGVLAQMEWLLAQGANINTCGEWLPLMLAVGNLDVAMTEYLLAHGADPHYANEDDRIPYGCGNYYIDSLDIATRDESFAAAPDKNVFDKILQIAVLFVKHGVTDIHTRCISIDSNTRTIRVSGAKVTW